MRFAKDPSRQKQNATLLTLAALVATSSGAAINPKITGAGWFEDEAINGVRSCSFAGGCEMNIYGVRMAPMPGDNHVLFTSDQLGGTQLGPALTKDNEFKSNSGKGQIHYECPDIGFLLGVPGIQDHEEYMSFSLEVMALDDGVGESILPCTGSSNACRVGMSYYHTPIAYEVTPAVVYQGHEATVIIDPKSADGYFINSKAFKEVKIDSHLMEFEDFDTSLGGYSKKRLRGAVGDQQPSEDGELIVRYTTGFALQQDTQMLHCSYDESDCYKIRTVPAIHKVSANQGVVAGGQELTVTGWGFNAGDVSASIDGNTCEVISQSDESFTCLTGPGSETVATNLHETHGLRAKYFQGGSLVEERLLMNAELPHNMLEDSYTSEVSGYFKAPATAGHNFYIACDDSCTFTIYDNADKTTTLGTVEVLEHTGARNYWYTSEGQSTGDISLTKDQYYYIELTHYEGSGSDYASIAVEINVDGSSHHHGQRKIQSLTTNTALQRETTNFVISGADGLEFKVNLLPAAISINCNVKQLTILTSATAAEFESAANTFFKQGCIGAGVKVTVDENTPNLGDRTFRMAYQKSVSVPIIDMTRLMVDDSATTATVTVEYPSETGPGLLSSTPLSGTFRLAIPKADSTTAYTEDIAIDASVATIVQQIELAAPEYKYKIDAWTGNEFDYAVDGRQIYFRFTGMTTDLGKITMQTVNLEGPVPISQLATDVVSQGSRIFYDVIPYEMIYTSESLPQIYITVNGLEAACHSLNCGYTYIADSASLSSVNYSGRSVTASGTSLPTQDVKICISNICCEEDSYTLTDTSATCTLEDDIVAGSWDVEFNYAHGRVNRDAISTVSQSIGSLSVSINSGSLNPNGWSLVTITATNMLNVDNQQPADFGVTIGGQECTIEEVGTDNTNTNDFVSCWSPALASGSSQTLVITMNGETASTSVNVAGSAPSITAVTPSDPSPVIKRSIVIDVDAGYTGNLDTDFANGDLEVFLRDTTGTLAEKAYRVVSASDSAKTVTFKFGGHYSGLYKVILYHKQTGPFGGNVQLDVHADVTSFSPSSGSVHGGTLVTINGGRFSIADAKCLDHPVNIGEWDCIVEECSETELKCRTVKRMNGQTEITDNESSDLIVFLRVSEEATNSASPDQFSYATSATPSLTSATVSYADGVYTVTFAGSGFTYDTSDAKVFFDGYEQTVDTGSSTGSSLVVTVTEINASSVSNIQIFTAKGSPSDANGVLNAGLSFTPQVYEVSSTSGSAAGGTVLITVAGVGHGSTGLTFRAGGSNSIFCSSYEVVAYSQVVCTVDSSSTFADATIKVDGVTCSNSNIAACEFSTYSAPEITSASVSGSTIVISGSNFKTAMTAEVTYAGATASATVDSTTQVTATFALGVPLSEVDETPIVVFLSSSYNSDHHSDFSNNNALLANPLSTPSATDLDCSFNGGCSLVISANGLSTQVQSGAASISVCGQTCEFDLANSDSSSTSCTISGLATHYSVENFEINEAAELVGTTFGSNEDYIENAFNDINTDTYADSSSGCFVGMGFKPDHVGVLTQMKYFMNRFNKEQYEDELKFQGSNNQNSWTTLNKADGNIHEGWNYVDFAEGDYPAFKFYRITSDVNCNIGELKLIGYEAIESSSSTHQCDALININGVQTTLNNVVTYKGDITPFVSSFYPRFANVKGGETITIDGGNFGVDASLITVTIDDKDCHTVTVSNENEITCVLGASSMPFPGHYVQVNIAGQGAAALMGNDFKYVAYWSDEDTWSGEYAPIEGDAVYIPEGQHLLVDVDSTPILSAVLVEGSLIFLPELDNSHERTFDAHYIMVRNGYMEVGTEEFPYTSKLTITMHGNKESPEIPIYGNKCIAVRNGVLELHGVPRTPTWTSLSATADIGSKQISLMVDVDWQEGEKIVIAPTGFDNFEAEERYIKTRINSKTFELDKKLQYKHYSGVETHGGIEIEMRAEVGLLTRNVVFRGDQETSAQAQYGAHIMLHSKGDESLTGRIENIELHDVGQAFQLGRYPLHFHIIGTVHNSYIRSNSIHHTYNRAVTFHAIDYLRVQHNVAYHTKGHTFFIEDAIERHNLIENNLAILTKKSWSLLNTDQTPASFWITNPNNIFRGNHAAGSDRYGYWYDLQTHSIGPSFDPNVCPENEVVGEFSDNVAHSNGRYGFRIFHNMVPRVNPCRGISEENPLVTAKFERLTSYKNLRNGAIADLVGDVRFIDFKVADNVLAGIEITKPGAKEDGLTQINGGLILGCSQNAEAGTTNSAHGFIAGQQENLTVKNIKFYKFDCGTSMAALGSCSHCFHPADTDSGARTTTFKNIYIDEPTVPKIIKYQYPFRAIFHDEDGSLVNIFNSDTGKNWQGGWTVPYFEHNEWSGECEFNERYNGHVCRPNVQVRRLAFYSAAPSYFKGMEMKILQWDGMNQLNQKEAPQSKVDYLLNGDYSIVDQKSKRNPSDSWAVPFVTGHKYKVHWRNGLDFEGMKVEISDRWEQNDDSVYIVMNHTDIRQMIQVQRDGNNVTNNSISGLWDSQNSGAWRSGHHVHFNATNQQEIHTVFNGRNDDKVISFIGHRCVWDCLEVIEEVECEETGRLWSDPASWPDNTVPVKGASFNIKSGWRMIFDLEDSPVYEVIQNNGCLEFLDEGAGTSKNLNVKHLFNRAGKITIGAGIEFPYQGNAKITLHGEKENAYIVFDRAVEAGNKAISNTGQIQMFGTNRPSRTRLARTAQAGATEIYVETSEDLGWVQGDKLGLAPTNYINTELDYVEIDSYDFATGKIELTEPIFFRHYGRSESTKEMYQVDIRGEVSLLTRNVQIVGVDVQSWGGQIVTSDNRFDLDAEGNFRKGQMILDNVEIRNCSQKDSWKAAIRFENAQTAQSSITNCAFHHGLSFGAQIVNSANIILRGNTWFDFTQIGVNLQSVNSVTFENNWVIGVRERYWAGADSSVDKESGLMVCGFYEPNLCTGLKVRNNVVAGGPFLGSYHIMGSSCNSGEQVNLIKNNVAHSGIGPGFVAYTDYSDPSQTTCYLFGTGSAAYKNTQDGVVGLFKSKKMILDRFTSVDNVLGASINIAGNSPGMETVIQNSFFHGETMNNDCSSRNGCKNGNALSGNCFDKKAIYMSQFVQGGKEIIPSMKSSLPYHKPKAAGSWWGKAFIRDTTFENFESSTTYCGKKQSVIELNNKGSDYQPFYELNKVKFENVADSALAFFFDPPSSWAKIDDCGQFPCTAPENVVMNFKNCEFNGPRLRQNMLNQFTIVSNNPSAVAGFKDCDLVSEWNAYYCSHSNVGLMYFDSLDGDTWDRSVQPIVITDDSTNYSNTLNSMMDHVWDGFYTGQLRLSRFPAMIEIDATNQRTYTISYTGTPPGGQRFTLHTDSEIKNLGVIIRIDYPKAGGYQIRNWSTGTVIKQNEWDDDLKAQEMVQSRFCGENRFVGVLNILEFYLPSGCVLDIEPVDSIETLVRMDWTMEEYFFAGGTTNFIDRLASSLGIHASEIKVVSVYEGSVYVQASIQPAEQDMVEVIRARYIKGMQDGTINLGAPILEAFEDSIDVMRDDTSDDDEDENDDDYIITDDEYLKIQESEEEDEKKGKLVLIIVGVVAGIFVASLVVIYLICKKKMGGSKAQIKQSMESIKAINHDESLEEQYHPKAEIANIYDDPDKMRAKINKADDVSISGSPEYTMTDEKHMEDKSPMRNSSRPAFIDVEENEPQYS